MPLVPVAEGDPHVPAHNEERDVINDLEVAVAGRVPFPVSPTLGSVLRWDGDKWATSKFRIFEGNGPPEGVIAAPVGSRYVNLTGAGGTAEYYKGSGTGTTGWTPINQDTGWQAITPGSGWAHISGQSGQARMINDVVYFRGAMERVSGSGLTVGSIPSGFQPPNNITGYARTGSEINLFDIHNDRTLTVSGNYNHGDNIYLGSCSGAPYKRT